MARMNDEVAAVLQEYADLMAITGGDAFRVRNYEKAARSVGGYPEDISLLDETGLRQIPNVGASIAAKIDEHLRTGVIHQLEELRAKVPAGVRRLTTIPTLGPKKAIVLYEELGIDSVDALEKAIRDGKLAGLRGFGAKTEENLLHGIELMHKAGQRVHLDAAMDLAEEMTTALSPVPGCQRVTYAGSLRRMRDTIGDIDILATAADSTQLMAAFCSLPNVAEVIATGDTKTSIRTTAGVQADLRVVPPQCWGAVLQYFTGAKAHNIRTRESAVRKKLKLSEYGLFVATGELIVSKTEEEVYHHLGLPWIPPTLREDTGEIEAALHGQLPALVTEADIRGDLHTHTNLSDGLASLDEMAAAAAQRGYAYFAVTDHAPNLYMDQMTDQKALAQRDHVRRLDGAYGQMTLLHGTELNIGPEGDLDWPGEFLSGFDLCVASIHWHFGQPRGNDQADHPCLREPQRQHHRAPQHTAHRQARTHRRRLGCRVRGLRPHGHRAGDRRLPRSPGPSRGPDQVGPPARGPSSPSTATPTPRGTSRTSATGSPQPKRGWLTPDNVINTWPLRRLQEFLHKKRYAMPSR
jgi:DNA polymerase (family X)